MNTVWQVQEAKNRFSEMIERAQSEGPQTITRHGRAVAQVVACTLSATAQRVQAGASNIMPADGFAHYLLAMPKVDGLQLPVRRSRKTPVRLGD